MMEGTSAAIRPACQASVSPGVNLDADAPEGLGLDVPGAPPLPLGAVPQSRDSIVRMEFRVFDRGGGEGSLAGAFGIGRLYGLVDLRVERLGASGP
jgi:hypothetical protein